MTFDTLLPLLEEKGWSFHVEGQSGGQWILQMWQEEGTSYEFYGATLEEICTKIEDVMAFQPKPRAENT